MADRPPRDGRIRGPQPEPGLPALKPAFKKDGKVTAGKASGINDSAAFIVLASEEKARALSREPLVWVTAWASAALEPSLMGFGPVPATAKALKKAGWKLSDVDLIELNEAFAALSLAVFKGFAAEMGDGRIPPIYRWFLSL